MSDHRSEFERELVRRLADAAPAAAPGALEQVRLAVGMVPQRRPWQVQLTGMLAVNWMQAAAAAVVVLLVVGLAGRLGPQAGDGPVTTPSPSPSTSPLVWSPERAGLDWPVPVRAEASSPPVSATLRPDPSAATDDGWFTDPSADIDGSAPGWLDLTTVRVHYVTGDASSASRVQFSLATPAPTTIPDPRDRWVAYGLVVDINADGRPDLRLGMDNAPGGQHRAWWTDLATGTTAAQTGPPYGVVGGRYFDTFLPGEKVFGRLLVQAQDVGAFRFYVWASMIEDGRVVATDYAPDVGWIDPGDGTP